MRRIINSTYVSLDGVIERLPEWHFDYLSEETQAFEAEQLAGSDALLMGRRTYALFAEAWPGQAGDFPDRINSMRKYVASTTLGDPAWENTVVISGDLVTEIRELRRQPGDDILMYGFGPVARTLLEHGLLDEIRLWFHPVFVGGGEPGEFLFRKGITAKLRPADVRVLDTGIVIASFQPLDRNERHSLSMGQRPRREPRGYSILTGT